MALGRQWPKEAAQGRSVAGKLHLGCQNVFRWEGSRINVLVKNQGSRVYSHASRGNSEGQGTLLPGSESAQESRVTSVNLWLCKPAQQPGLPKRYTQAWAQLT
ncbi:hypothetical protein P7K49_033064, partial [Saguinus oedipus]